MRNLVYLLVTYVVGKFILPMLLAIAVFSALMVFMIPLLIRSVIASFQVHQGAEGYGAEQTAQDQTDFDEYCAQYDEDKQKRHY